MTDKDNYLGRLLELAGISQGQMAAHLELSQSQVSRYAKNSQEVPMGAYKAWEAFCGEVTSKVGLDIGSPMNEIAQRIKLIENYCEVAPEIPEDFPIDQVEHIGKADETTGKKTLDYASELIEGVQRISRKPRVGLFGRFDMGKSKFANLVMGSDSLPSSYQPATSIACLVRHIDDKPDWQPELVWIFNSHFDLNKPDSKGHCEETRLIGGGYEILKEVGTHAGDRKAQFKDAAYAVVYVDSPFLKGCDIIDLPGYEHQDQDDKRAEMAQRISDIVIYVSMAQGFMNGNDRSYLAQLIRNLPPLESPENGVSPLRNLFVVATRADIAKGDTDDILDRAASYSFDGISTELIERGEAIGVPIDEAAFRDRFFTYSAEDKSLQLNMNEDLTSLLKEITPKSISIQLEKSILQAKESGTKSFQALVNTIQETLEHREEAQQEVQRLMEHEPLRIQQKKIQAKEITSLIRAFKKQSELDVKEACSKWVDVEKIESTLKRYGKDKKKAAELAPTYIVEKLQHSISEKTKAKSEKLSREVDAYLSGYDLSLKASASINDSWEFNAKGAFAGALAGIGTFGALATWASVVAAGSNLGGYILAAKLVSALSAVGISVGGTASVATALSILGGPITIAAGIAILTAAIAASIFGDSWQTKLAKKIHKSMRSNNIEEQMIKGLNHFWDETENAFKQAAEVTEEDFKRKLVSLEKIATSTEVDVLKRHLSAASDLRDFFAGIPWKRIA